MLKISELVTLAVLTVPVMAVEPLRLDTDNIKWEMTRYSSIVTRDGKRYIQVRVPRDARDLDNQNCAFFDVDLGPFSGYDLEFSVKVRGRNISEPGQGHALLP